MKHLGRKVYHLAGGLGLLSVYYLLGRNQALVFYGTLFIVVLVLDGARLLIPAWNRFVFTRFKSFVRENEAHKLTGTAPYILGIGLSLYAYAPEIATAAICFLAVGDVAATTIGERYGKTRIGDKSLEGTTAFAFAAFIAGFMLSFVGVHLPTWLIIVGALVAAGVELLPLMVNDNLSIPIVSGAVMELALRWVGR
jgi:glycerol-3-phosphate acyltransferase PlsY